MVGVSTSKANLAESSVSIYDTPAVEKVQVDLKVALGIIQAEHEQISVEGYLFGVHIGSTMEITNSTPLPPERISKEYDSERLRDTAEKDFLEDRENFQAELSASYKQLQMDSKVVGWYYIAWPDPVTSKEVLQAQIAFENKDPHFVLLSYDPWRSASGNLSLRALRVTKKFAAMFQHDFQSKKFDAINVHEIDVFQEIPIEIHAPLLNQLFLYDAKFESSVCADGNIYYSEKEHEAYIRRHISSLSHTLEGLQIDLADCSGMRQNRRFQRDTRETEAEARKSGHLHCQTIKADAAHINTLTKQVGQNASLLEALCEANEKSEATYSK